VYATFYAICFGKHDKVSILSNRVVLSETEYGNSIVMLHYFLIG